jgi:isoprenylcysteine carboxyl methyltransferase (ICMT) family protein YpbQ
VHAVYLAHFILYLFIVIECLVKSTICSVFQLPGVGTVICVILIEEPRQQILSGILRRR